MAGLHLLDRLIGNEYPSFATDADVRCFEEVPYADRIAAESTYDAIKFGAAHNPDAPAIQFLPNADPADTPIVISHRDFVSRVTQAANMFQALGVGSGDVVSLLLPLLPEALSRCSAPKLPASPIPSTRCWSRIKSRKFWKPRAPACLVALGPMPGTDIWQKVEQVRGT